MFTAETSTGRELWLQTGNALPRLVKDIRPGYEGSDPRDVLVIGSGAQARLLFSADDGEVGRELWISDGTAGLIPSTRLLGTMGVFAAGLDAQGRSRMPFVLPQDPSLLWARFFAAGLTLRRVGIGDVTSSVRIDIVPKS